MTVPGGGFESLLPASKKNLALILFFTTIQANFGLEMKTRPWRQSLFTRILYLSNWSSLEDPVLHYFMGYEHKEEMQNEAGSQPFAKEKIWRAGIEPPGASLWSWHPIGACAPKFAPDSKLNCLVGGWRSCQSRRSPKMDQRSFRKCISCCYQKGAALSNNKQ